MLGLDGADDPRSSQQIQNPTTRPGLTSAMAYPTPTAAKAAERAQSKSTGASSEKPSDLNHLKAKVIASMSRSRAENSSTPTKETNAAYTGTNWPQGERTAPKQPLATERKGSQTDVDGLLAEDAGNQPNAQDGPANGQKPTGNAEKGRSNGPTPLHDVRPGTAISPDSSATSEQGEIQWLEMTGFNDPVYRREALQRHREMLALEVKRAELAREAHIAQEERAYLARAHSVMPREEAELGYRRSSVVSGTVRSSSGYSMAPPPIPSRGGRDPGTVLVAASGRERSPEIRHPVDRASESRFVLSPPPSMSGSGLAKRRYPHDDELPEVVYAEKLVRVDSRGLSARRRDGDADYPAFRAYSGNDVGPQREVEFVRGHTRFFIVKSFNSDNVIQAQEDGVWATQEKNEGIFSEAFHCSGNVILIFSINKSMQFQGYARMESAPGTAETPPWAKGLLWKSSGPFNIRWIKIANTHFSRVGHLKNPFNEYQAVLVARDGQEVEPQCGLALCELINEEADRTRVR
ncbi:MAG: hypothetical protein M1832_001193 [Thelocarpon impressellum]|nr:MAG: hypothetical protein M1832_001193 [Thelocarpon impressellum]